MGLEMAPAERKCDPAPGARNREDAAGCWARRVLSFMTPLMKLGMQRPLVQQDIEPICARDRCEHNHQRFVAHWRLCMFVGAAVSYCAAVHVVHETHALLLR